jgi:hypothetical protein
VCSSDLFKKYYQPTGLNMDTGIGKESFQTSGKSHCIVASMTPVPALFLENTQDFWDVSSIPVDKSNMTNKSKTEEALQESLQSFLGYLDMVETRLSSFSGSFSDILKSFEHLVTGSNTSREEPTNINESIESEAARTSIMNQIAGVQSQLTRIAENLIIQQNNDELQDATQRSPVRTRARGPVEAQPHVQPQVLEFELKRLNKGG